MGNYQGRRVAARVLRVYLSSDIGKIRRVGCFRLALAMGVGQLTATHAVMLQGGDWAENP